MKNFIVPAVAAMLAAGYIYVLRVCPIDPLPSYWEPAPKSEGVFASNNVLQGIEKVGAGQLPFPEDVAIDAQGRLYTGCKDGWIKRVWPENGRVENWTYVGGQPLGLVIGRYGEILVCEPLMGLLNVTENKVEVLSSEADGQKYRVADELDVSQDGTIYFTDASNKFTAEEAGLDIAECRPNGRLLKYDPTSRKTSVLLKDLFFPNGVALSAAEDFLVYCETSKVRCSKLWLKGEKIGKTEKFIDGLPGYPDNVHLNAAGNFWIAVLSERSWGTELISRSPLLKRFVAVLLMSTGYNPSTLSAKVLEVSKDGKPLTFYEDPSGKSIAFVTTAIQSGDYLYLGNLAFDYIGKLKLNSSLSK